MHDTQHARLPDTFEQLVAAEWSRLVRICARLSGDSTAAEDLAQETLLEAWRRHDRVVDWAGYRHWLAAIARYVCLRWCHRQGRQQTHEVATLPDAQGMPDNDSAVWAAIGDVEVELERHELADLLDRALALLPPDARAILIEKYVAESPHADIAARLGISEGAVAMRLQRGKLAFRRVLATTLQAEAAAYGLADEERDGWQETRIWCPHCGQHRLSSRFLKETNVFDARCSGCSTQPGGYFTGIQVDGLFDGVSGYKAALSRVMQWDHEYLRAALDQGKSACMACGRLTPVRVTLGGAARQLAGDVRGVDASCMYCGCSNWMVLHSFIRCLPQVRRFWQKHPRMRTLPERLVEVDGQPAVVASFRSIGTPAQIDVVSRLDTYAVLHIHEDTGTSSNADAIQAYVLDHTRAPHQRPEQMLWAKERV